MNETRRAPELSVILPTDTAETIEPVLEKLRCQTAASRVEVILVTPSPDEVAKAAAHESAFASVRVVQIESLTPLGAARAAGIRAAVAPLIFVGETHSYLHPDAVEKLLDAAEDRRWSAIVPGFENANPKGVFSWAGFVSDYGRWSKLLPAGEIQEAPVYDVLRRREALLELGDCLAPMLSHGEDLRRAMEASGQRVLFHPEARIDHVNIEQPWAWFHERFLIGIMIGKRRARRWSWGRRVAYIAGAGLIPAVLLWRVWPCLSCIAGAQRLPAATLPAIALLYVAKAAGELMGYAGGGNSAHEKEMIRYEIRRLDYVARTT